MKRVILGWVVGLMAANSAFADHVKYKKRCSEDSLAPAQAIERVEWAARCGHITAEDRHDALYTGAANSPRPRPEYPLFATDDLNAFWQAPVARGAACAVPGGYTVQGFCTSSCYTPDQVVLFSEGFTPIGEAHQAGLETIVALDSESTLERLLYTELPVDAYTSEFRDTWHDILVFKMLSGGTLKVTPNHPVVDREGKVRAAETMKVGEALVHYETGPDAILAIDRTRFFGKVYNVAPKTEHLASHIVVAQGYLNGSAFYQNDGVDYLNRKIVRQRLAENLLP